MKPHQESFKRIKESIEKEKEHLKKDCEAPEYILKKFDKVKKVIEFEEDD